MRSFHNASRQPIISFAKIASEDGVSNLKTTSSGMSVMRLFLFQLLLLYSGCNIRFEEIESVTKSPPLQEFSWGKPSGGLRCDAVVENKSCTQSTLFDLPHSLFEGFHSTLGKAI